MEQVTLLLNDSLCSNEAVKLLNAKKVPYDISPSVAPEVPCVRYKGNYFCGLGEIRLFVVTLQDSEKE